MALRRGASCSWMIEHPHGFMPHLTSVEHTSGFQMFCWSCAGRILQKKLASSQEHLATVQSKLADAVAAKEAADKASKTAQTQVRAH